MSRSCYIIIGILRDHFRPARSFLARQKKIFSQIEWWAIPGQTAPRTLPTLLTGNSYMIELRTFLSDKIARTLYFYLKGAKVIITHGFIKKTQKTPTKEIEKAKLLRKIHNERRGL
jgi:phage-related protein